LKRKEEKKRPRAERVEGEILMKTGISRNPRPFSFPSRFVLFAIFHDDLYLETLVLGLFPSETGLQPNHPRRKWSFKREQKVSLCSQMMFVQSDEGKPKSRQEKKGKPKKKSKDAIRWLR
jgi:hypothetical protein